MKKSSNVLMSLFIGIGLILNLLYPKNIVSNINQTSTILSTVDSIFQNLKLSININSFFILVLSLGVLFMLNHVRDLEVKTSIFQKIISIWLAFFSCLGNLYSVNGNGLVSMALFWEDAGQVIKVVWALVAYYCLFEMLQLFFEQLFNKKNMPTKEKGFVYEQLVEHTYRTSFIVLSTSYLVSTLLNYPGVIMGDSFRQILSIQEYTPLKGDNPIISTLFISIFIKIGDVIGSANIGLFLHSVVQSLIVAASLSYSIMWIQRIGKSAQLTLGTLLVFSFAPIITSLVYVVTKDILAASFFVVTITSLAVYLFNANYFWQSKTYLIFYISLIVTVLFRLNNIYAFVLSIIISVVALLINKNKKNLKFVGSIVICLVVSVFCNSLLNKLEEEPNMTGKREALSIPFQQTARYATLFDNEIPTEDKAVINRILDYDIIKSHYSPRISDNVKNTYRPESDTSDLMAYFEIWYKQFKQQPVIFLDATLHQNYSMFYLNKNNNIYYDGLKAAVRVPGKTRDHQYEELGYKENKHILSLQSTKMYLFSLVDSLPVLSQVNNLSFYIILLLFSLGISFKYSHKKTLYLLLPITFLAMTFFAGPVINGHIRYYLPFFFSTPIVLAWLMREHNLTTFIGMNDK